MNQNEKNSIRKYDSIARDYDETFEGKIRGIFFIMRRAQKMIDKSERRAGRPRTVDYIYWEKNGWLDGKQPWKG